MAVVMIRADRAPVPAIEAALAALQPSSDAQVADAQTILAEALYQAQLAEKHRGRRMGEGPYCGCCGQPKTDELWNDPLIPSDCPVTKENGPRPAGKPDECFYCHSKIGEQHKPECVCRRKTVRIRLSIEFDHDTVESWDREAIDFHLNESSYCLSNLMTEIEEDARAAGCLCRIAVAEVMGGAGL